MRLGFENFSQTISHTIHYLCHCARSGQPIFTESLLTQLFQSFFGSQSCVGNRCTEGGVLLVIGFSQLAQGFCCLGMPLFPKFISSECRLCTHAEDTCALFPQSVSILSLPRPKIVSAGRAFPSQYLRTISAGNDLRSAPCIFDAAGRRSSICEEVRDSRKLLLVLKGRLLFKIQRRDKIRKEFLDVLCLLCGIQIFNP